MFLIIIYISTKYLLVKINKTLNLIKRIKKVQNSDKKMSKYLLFPRRLVI